MVTLRLVWLLTWDVMIMSTLHTADNSNDEDCSFVFHSSNRKSGNFSTPNWPFNYSHNKKCTYVFRGRPYEVINITFLEFDLELRFPKGCLTDYIDISTVTALNVKRLIGRYCGSDVPTSMLSMHPQTEIIFRSNHVNSRGGFFGQYQFIDESMIGPPSMISKSGEAKCGGSLVGPGGLITSPNYPNSFPKQVDCVWQIRVKQNQHIYVRIVQMQLFGSIANCKEAHLAIYDGYENYDYEHHEPKKYCGDLKYYKSLDDKVQLSANNRLLIRFKSDLAMSQWEDQVSAQDIIGFKLIWTAVTFKTKGECSEFECEQSKFCLSSDSGSKCRKLGHFCIDRSLLCNGMPNCGEQDLSDENNCNLLDRNLVFGFSITVVLIVLSLILCWWLICRKAYRDPPEKLPSLCHHQQAASFHSLGPSGHQPHSRSPMGCSIRDAQLDASQLDSLQPFQGAFSGQFDTVDHLGEPDIVDEGCSNPNDQDYRRVKGVPGSRGQSVRKNGNQCSIHGAMESDYYQVPLGYSHRDSKDSQSPAESLSLV